MTCLVVSSIKFFFFAYKNASSLRTHHNLITSLFKIFKLNSFFIVSSSNQSSLINHVSNISTRKTRSSPCKIIQIYRRVMLYFSNMHFKYPLSSFNIRQINNHLSVKSTRTKQSRVKYIRSVGSSKYNYSCVSIKAVHFNKHLV